MRVLIIGAGRMGTAMMSAYEKQLNTKKDISVEIVEKNKKKLKTLKKKYKNYTFYSEIPIQWNGAVLILAIKPQVFKNVSAEIIIKKLKTNAYQSSYYFPRG